MYASPNTGLSKVKAAAQERAEFTAAQRRARQLATTQAAMAAMKPRTEPLTVTVSAQAAELGALPWLRRRTTLVDFAGGRSELTADDVRMLGVIFGPIECDEAL